MRFSCLDFPEPGPIIAEQRESIVSVLFFQVVVILTWEPLPQIKSLYKKFKLSYVGGNVDREDDVITDSKECPWHFKPEVNLNIDSKNGIPNKLIIDKKIKKRLSKFTIIRQNYSPYMILMQTKTKKVLNKSCWFDQSFSRAPFIYIHVIMRW